MKRILYLVAVWLVASSFTTIHLMGDSTMAEKDLSDGKLERGWGMMFPNFVDDTFRVINYAQNGRSTKSFIDKGLWDMVQYALQPGDYVFIQFGHNDAKADDPSSSSATMTRRPTIPTAMRPPSAPTRRISGPSSAVPAKKARRRSS